MAYCGKCLHVDVCKTADSCDGHVPKCKHFLQKGTLIPVTCKLGEKGCYGDGKCRYKKDCENKVITHADQLRGVTDEEMAKVFTKVVANGCPPEMDWDCQKDKEGWEACDKCWCKWLQQPVEGQK